MEVVCEHCSTKLNVPDEKVPHDQRVKVICPKCKKKFDLESREAPPEAPSPAEAPDFSETGRFRLRFLSKHAQEPELEGTYGYDDYTEYAALDFFEEETKLAMATEIDGAYAKKTRLAAQELGYKYIPTQSIRDAIGKMRFHHFDLVILFDGFEGYELEGSPVLRYLNYIPMDVRRRIFLALLSDRVKTMDNMMAFSMSANVVVNTKDIDKLPAVLKKAISDNQKFYKVFMDTLVELGKA